jgi:hypothetical protein
VPVVRIRDKRINVGDESRPLLHGEVHFWRLSPHRWRDCLRAARDLGLDIVSTYVCWEYHEVAEGRFDFRGDTDPQRDLEGFLRLAADEGFWVLLRPGPYIYSEWPNSGVPTRVVRYHRLNPAFRAQAERYMAAVVEVAAPCLATRGGPIVLWQADNEPDPWPDVYGSQLGLGLEPGPFQAFLREQYRGDLQALNATWDAGLGGFEDARAVLAPAVGEPASVVRFLDFCRFQHWYTAEIVRWTVETYRRLGVDVPIYANVYSGFGVQHWREMERVADLAGPDFYPTAEFRGEPAEHRRLLERVRYTRTYSALPYIPEFEAGIWQGRHERVGVLGPGHYRLVCLSALLAGAAGWGWYMLVNRDNWLMSPINEIGQPRPDLAAEFARIVRVFRTMDPPGLEKVTYTAVAMDVLPLCAKVGGLPGEPLLEGLHRADIDYEYFDVETGQIARPLMLYAGAGWLSQFAQERLLAYVDEGGTLVFFQDLPLRDDRLRPLNLLRLRQPDGVLRAGYPRRLTLHLDDETATFSSPTFFIYDEVPGEALVAERAPEAPGTEEGRRVHATLPVGERYTIGYCERRGRGSIVCLGVAPDPDVLLALNRWLGVAVPSRSATGHVSTALLRRDDALFLVAVNHGEEEREATVVLEPGLPGADAIEAIDLFTGQAAEVFKNVVHVRLARKSAKVVRLTPDEAPHRVKW